MFLPPPKSDPRWVYDDPSGVPETPTAVYAAKPKRGKIVRFPFSAPATPKAA
jgi:hypothetical protein